MSVRGIIAAAMWTELLDAMKKDYPDVKFDNKSGPNVAKVIRENAEYITELTNPTPPSIRVAG